MRWFWPSKLPCSLLLATFVLSAPVQAVEKLQLTPDNFDVTTKSGYWFIEHFSPWCHHCQAFMPLWEELVEAYKDTTVHFAQVDCSVHGDLCTSHDVKGYPQMNMYKDGKMIGKYDLPRTRDKLDDFITDKTAVSLFASKSASTPDVPPTSPTLADPNPNGEVVVLEDAAAIAKIKEEGNVFVKFYAPWCGHCKKLAPAWKELAKAMQHKLKVAEVDCEDHKALCTKEGVTGFPMLFFYPSGGAEKTEYTGNRKFEAMKAWADRATKQPVQHLSYDDLEKTVGENDVLYLFLHAPDDTQSLTRLHTAARPLLGSPPVFTSSSQQFLDRYNVVPPVLLALKDHDISTPTDVLRTDGIDAPELERWMAARRLPSALELNEASFQDVMKSRARPLVVLISAPPSTNIAEREWTVGETTKLGLAWRARVLQRGGDPARPVVFAWMDAERWKKWLGSMYGIKGAGQVVVTDHQSLLYYDVAPDGTRLEIKGESIFPALEAAIAGTLSPRHSENVVERVARMMNSALTSVEHVIMENTMLFGFFAVCGVIGIFVFIRNILASDAAAFAQSEKGRLD